MFGDEVWARIESPGWGWFLVMKIWGCSWSCCSCKLLVEVVCIGSMSIEQVYSICTSARGVD